MEEVLMVSGLVGTQIVFALYLVFLNKVLNLGVHPLFLVVFSNLTGSLFLLPFAVVLERKKWPRTLTPTLGIQLASQAIGGVTVFQTLTLLGVEKTSPAIAAAMPNLAPGFTFIIAACLRLEKVEMRCKFTWTKIIGTILCLTGVIAMSFLQSPTTSSKLTYKVSLGDNNETEWIIGCGYLFISVVIISCITVLQAVTMQTFRAPFSLCFVTFSVGAIFTAITQIIVEGKMEIGSTAISLTGVIGIVLLGGAVTGVCVTFQTWCVKQKGPVLVSMFSPIQTVFSAVFAALILRQLISIGSTTGIALMFAGLYMFLWAKKKESYQVPDDIAKVTVNDVEKPLLS
ncbi:WAT1-related protein At5g47470-like [Dioscorea cayenensis subsp. rotundata]|uniref:WAT1-related protein n=1 Tax=Dioscorea cayennensis subsp. rotundata TaxID=55577 RepID=A0AB40C3V6_DIOCR|nr:WAT1-related protein At5g47470-like [Dioscorea cayenensis subsp. rotundata]